MIFSHKNKIKTKKYTFFKDEKNPHKIRKEILTENC